MIGHDIASSLGQPGIRRSFAEIVYLSLGLSELHYASCLVGAAHGSIDGVKSFSAVNRPRCRREATIALTASGEAVVMYKRGGENPPVPGGIVMHVHKPVRVLPGGLLPIATILSDGSLDADEYSVAKTLKKIPSYISHVQGIHGASSKATIYKSETFGAAPTADGVYTELDRIPWPQGRQPYIDNIWEEVPMSGIVIAIKPGDKFLEDERNMYYHVDIHTLKGDERTATRPRLFYRLALGKAEEKRRLDQVLIPGSLIEGINMRTHGLRIPAFTAEMQPQCYIKNFTIYSPSIGIPDGNPLDFGAFFVSTPEEISCIQSTDVVVNIGPKKETTSGVVYGMAY